MKLSATTADANINARPLKAISLEGCVAAAEGKSDWTKIAARFYTYTKETGKVDTKSFEELIRTPPN
mgnify:CR=1 FL=1